MSSSHYIAQGLSLDSNELKEQFVRSPGPGGQNVNKVSTAVELRFDIANSASLPDAIKQRLLARSDQRLTRDGELIISASRFRSQDRNREDARNRLLAWLREGMHVERPRIATRPGRGAVERRIKHKKLRAKTKQRRSGKWED